MKKFVSVFLLSLATWGILQARSFYLDSRNGDDLADGSTIQKAWKTLQKLNQSMSQIKPGDTIFFVRGSIFRGTISFVLSGTAQKPIVLTAAGTGNMPVINGSVELTEWSQEGSNVYSTPVSTLVTDLFLNDRRLTAARYPNQGWLTADEGFGKNGFRDNDLDFSDHYWDGAIVRFRPHKWLYETRRVQFFVGKQITFDSPSQYDLLVGSGYYLENHPAAMDADFEWYYDAGQKKVFLRLPSGKQPSSYLIEAAVRENGLATNWNLNYIQIRNLKFEKFQGSGLLGLGLKNSIISGNEVRLCNYGILIYGSEPTAVEVSNNKVSDCTAQGISLIDALSSVVSNNMVRNSGIIPGYGISGDNGARGIYVGGISSKNCLVERNEVDSSGYSGITCMGEGHKVQYNILKNSMLTLSDGGALYTWGSYSKNLVFAHNFISGVEGNDAGSPFQGKMANAIYLDDFVNHITVSSNMVEKYSDIGILLHNADYITVQNNIVAGNTCLALLYDFAGETYHIASSGNEFFGLSPMAFPLWIQSSTSNLQLDFKDNIYANPYNPVKVRLKDPSNDLFLGLERWKSEFGKDGGSETDQYNWNLLEVKDTISENLIKNGNFDSGTGSWIVWFSDQVKTSWENSAGMDGGAMKLTGNSRASAGYMRTYTSKFPFKKSHTYLVTGSFKASVHTTLYLESENTVAGWQYPNFSAYLPLVSSERKNFRWVFAMPNDDYQSDLYIQMPWHTNGQWLLLDNMGVYEVSAISVSPFSKVFFFTNPSKDRIEYSLKQAKFVDIRGKQYSGKLTLEAWTGKVLILTEGTFSLEEPPEKAGQILLYPNPVARGQMLTVALTGIDSTYNQIRIVSSAGRIIELYSLTSSTGEFLIPTQKLYGGIYYLQLLGKEGKKEKAFVVVQSK